MRLVGFAVLLGAVGASIDCVIREEGNCDTAGTLALAGTVVTLGSVIYDIATVRGAVRRQNRTGRAPSLRFAPTYSRSRRAAGLSVGIRF